MHSTATRHIEHPKTLRQPANERCDRSGKKERNKSRTDKEKAGHGGEL
jgi:hypothetical protein